MWRFSTLCFSTTTAVVHCRLVLWSVDRRIILILFADCWARENYTLDVFVVNSRWIKGSIQHHRIAYYKSGSGLWLLQSSLIHSRVHDLYERTWKVDLEWLVHWPTAPENFDGDTTTDRLDPTWKSPSRLKSTYSTRLAGLISVSVLSRGLIMSAANVTDLSKLQKL